MIELNEKKSGTGYVSPEIAAEYFTAEAGFCSSGKDSGEAFGDGGKYDGWVCPQN